jgi:hypothetical protein
MQKSRRNLIVGSIITFGFSSFSQGIPDGKNSWKHLDDVAYKQYKNGQIEAAIKTTEQAAQIAQIEYGKESSEVATSLGNLGALHRAHGNPSKGDPLIRKAKAIRDRKGILGVPIGIQTEVFFDEAAKTKSKNVQSADQPEPQRSGQ